MSALSPGTKKPPIRASPPGRPQTRNPKELPSPCGPVSRRLADLISCGEADPLPSALSEWPLLADRDVQLAFWMCYGGFNDVDDGREWDLEVLRLRTDIEASSTRSSAPALGAGLPVPDRAPIGASLLGLVADDEGPHLSAYLRRDGTDVQMREFLRERSVQQLKEPDPQSFVLPRLEGAAKVALAEIQYDEYGAGRVENLHQDLYARTLEAVGLDAAYGAYIAEVSTISLASANVMSLFGLNRRLRGAAIGHFAAIEASSAVPSRRIAAGLERLGMPSAAAENCFEHVEADSVHEQIAARELALWLFRLRPPGAARRRHVRGRVPLHLDALSGSELLNRWASDGSLEDRGQQPTPKRREILRSGSGRTGMGSSSARAIFATRRLIRRLRRRGRVGQRPLWRRGHGTTP